MGRIIFTAGDVRRGHEGMFTLTFGCEIERFMLMKFEARYTPRAATADQKHVHDTVPTLCAMLK